MLARNEGPVYKLDFFYTYLGLASASISVKYLFL